jgi:type I restriction enzyme R subunit
MRNHTLMQTIARANRIYPEKHSGLIVDYANVFASLEKALAIYGAGQGGQTPVRDKSKLVADLGKSLDESVKFCASHGVKISAIEEAPLGSFDRVQLIGDAVEVFVSPDPLRKEFLAHVRLVRTLFQAIKPDPSVIVFSARVSCLSTIANSIREMTGEEPADISGILWEVNKLLDRSIGSDGFHIPKVNAGWGKAVIDLSKIDFAALAKRFKKSKTKNIELEQLKAAIKDQLGRLIRQNKTRADYLAKFEELIESYNSGSRNIDELFRELVALSRQLTDEEERHVREHLSEEELTVFDVLTRPDPELTPEEREEVKKVARALLAKLKSLFVLDWRQTAQARAQVRLTIEDTLDEGLPRPYTPEVYRKKVSALFEYVYESYVGQDLN